MIEIHRDRLEQVLTLLAEAARGNYNVQLPNFADSEEDAFLELEVATNMLIEELRVVHQRNSDQRAEIERQAEQLHQQQDQLVRALSTPIVVVAPGVLTLPVIGNVEAERAQQMTEAILERVVSERATHVILDLTGAGEIRPATVKSLVRMVQSLRLIGSRCILTGISPAMARTLVSLDFDSSRILTLPQLADALTLVLAEKGRKRTPVANKTTAAHAGLMAERNTDANPDTGS